MSSGSIILGIEAALSGGSLSIMRSDEVIDSWVGTGSISRAELLLPAIDDLLRRNHLSTRDLEQIVISTGPGSFTGIRIGIATALGLCTALSIRCCGTTALEAIARSISVSGEIAVAVPMGRNMVCVQRFKDLQPDSNPQTMSFQEFFDDVSSHREVRYILHGELAKETRASNVLDAGYNIADHLCRSAAVADCKDALEPLFVQQTAN